MDANKIMKIFEDTAFVHTSCTDEEHKVAEYLQAQCAELGLDAHLEPFAVTHGKIEKVTLMCDGEEIPCTGYQCSGSGEVEGELYYLANNDPWSLEQCRGKIVMVDGYLGYWTYQDMVEHGAIGFITYDGSVNYADEDIDQRQLRPTTHKGNRILGVNVNAKTATALVKKQPKSVKISIKQEEYEGTSYNVVADIPGEKEEMIVFTAHYDTTSLSTGAYDNMSGCIGILSMAEHFLKNKPKYSLRFVWCGSEEVGLLGSKAYVAAHEEEMKKTVFCINLDMIGTIMGKFRVCCTAEKKLVPYMEYMAMEYGFGMDVYQDVYPSDSTPMADAGVPGVTFVRRTTQETGTIHNRYDSIALMSGEAMLADIGFMTAFADRMANAAKLPVDREIPEEMKEELDYYLNRKRRPKDKK